MKKINWNDVQETQEFKAPPAGGYVLAICDVVDVPGKEYLKIYYDIAAAADNKNEEFVGFYGRRHESSGGTIDLPNFIRSYKQTALGFFKAFLKAIEKSPTNNFSANSFDGDEKKLNGMVLGAVLGEEEYINKQGKLRLLLKPVKLMGTDEIMAGHYTIPEVKKLPPDQVPPAENAAAAVNTNGIECPF